MPVRITAALLAFLAFGAAPAHAQLIRGVVGDAADEQPLPGVHVVLLDSEGATHDQAISDDDGAFRLEAPRSGEWIVAADFIGYRNVVSRPIDVNPAEQVDVEVWMAVQAIELNPLVVTGRSRIMSGDVRRFYERMERAERTGIGDFVSREDIERRGPLRATDLFQTVASTRVVRGLPGRGAGLRMSSGCVPAIYIDGSAMNRMTRYDSLDDYVAVQSIEGIEVYRGAGAQVDHFHDPHGCGLILVWTRRGVPDEEARGTTWSRLALGLAALGALFIFGR